MRYSAPRPGATPPLSQRSHTIVRVSIFGALIAILATIPGAWTGTLWDNSETAYSEVAREILLTHDTIVMHLNGVAWFIQPPLYFWTAALCGKLFGLTTFSMRLPSIVATIGMSVGLAAFAGRLLGTRVARYASLILSTMLMQVIIGRLAIMDAMLDASVMFTILAWARAWLCEQQADERNSAFIFGAVTAALGTLTKGPVALALPMVVLIPWILLEQRHQRASAPSRQAMVLAGIAFLAILTPWFLMFSMRSGVAGLRELLLHYTVGRYLGVIENQTGPWFYYVPVVILGVFPWTGVFCAALCSAASSFRREVSTTSPSLRNSLLRLSIFWSLIPPIFFSFAQTKLPNYIALALPGMALACALWLDERSNRKSTSVIAAFAVMPFLIASLIVAMWIFAFRNTLTNELTQLLPYAIVFVGLIFAGAIAAVVLLFFRSTTRYAPYALAAGTLLAMGELACTAVPLVEQFKPIPTLALEIDKARQTGDMVAIQGVSGLNSLLFYSAPPITVLDSPDVVPSSLSTNPRDVLSLTPRVLLVAPTRRPNPDPLYGRHRRTLAISGKDTLFLIDGPEVRR